MTKNDIHTRCNGHCSVARPQALAGQMQCHQAPGARSVNGHTGSFEIIEIRYPVRSHSARLASIRALVHRHSFGIAEEEVGVVCVEGTDEARGLGSGYLGKGDASVLETFVCDFE